MSRTPDVRFKGFEKEWEHHSLRDFGSVAMCKRIFKDQTNSDGDIPFYKIGTFGGEPDAYISKDLFEQYRNVFPYPEKGDALISASGSIGRTVVFDGKPSYFQDSNIVWLKHDNRITNPFLAQLYHVVNWGGLEGSTIKRLYNENILNTETDIPEIDEQKTIACFLTNLDTLIEQNQSEVDRLRNLKKAMLQKMFPQKGSKVPEIRFKDFSDVWKYKKFSQIASMHARIGWQNLRKSEFLTSGDYYLITGTDFVDGRVNFTNCHFVKKERYDQDPHIQVSNGSILITKDGTLGKVAYVSGLNKPATLNAGVFNVNPIDYEAVDTLYLYQYLKAPFLLDYVAERATGGTIKHLNQNILVDFPVPLPSVEEQRLIGQYFQDLDSLIEQRQSNTDRLRHLKQSMLQRMFV